MAVPYKLNYFEIETGIDSTSTLIHTGDFTATKVKKYLATSNDILLGDGTTTPLSGLQPTGNYITALTGEATATGPGSAAITLTNSAVIGKLLTGLSITGSAIVSTDTILQAFGKAQNQINGKQDTITLTTTGTSGAATLIGATLNIPQYTDTYVGTVTSVAALTLGTAGTDLSSTVANSTTTPVITLNVPTASAVNRGALSAADWTTFNSKQDTVTLTTTGSSGASTFISNTLNVPTYTLSGLGGVPTTRQLTINGTAYDLSADRSWSVGTVTSVGLTMPAAFSIANSPVTGAGTIAVTGAGLASQYIRGDGALGDFPNTGGGGSSVSYYLNGSVNQGTFVGNTYYEMNKTPVIGAGTDFTINADGYIAQFITDANDPASLLIPGGNWNVEMYFSASSGGGSPSFYVELYKYDGSTFTLLGSSSATPEGITNGTAIDIYYTSLAVPETVLTLTDRLAIRVYVTPSGRTITLHTEDNHLSEIVTTFSNGLTALNGLTKQVQFLAVGTSGTDFNISSSVDTHTFNLPTASATNRGALSSTDWTTFNNKQDTITNPVTGTGTTNYLPKWSSSSAIGNSAITDDGTTVTLISRALSGTSASFSSSATATAFIPTSATIPTNGMYLGAANTLNFATNSGSRMSIGTTGSVTMVSTLSLGNYLTITNANTFIYGGTTVGSIQYGNSTSSTHIKTYGATHATLANVIQLTNNSVVSLTLSATGAATFASLSNGLVKSTSGLLSNATAGTDYQAPITLTTTGTSGAATFIANTLNIPNYADGGVLSLSAIGSTPNANGATITGTVLNLQPADASFGGVMTTGTQTIAGAKTFNSDLVVNGLTVGRGGGNLDYNTAVGKSALAATSTSLGNTAVGAISLTANTSGENNTAVGSFALSSNTTGTLNVAIGHYAGTSLITGTNNIFLGYNAGITQPSNESNRTWIGNTSTTSTWVGGNLLVGTTTNSTFALDVTGTARITGQLTLGSTITNGTYTYTLPSATGTLALTSQLHDAVTLSAIGSTANANGATLTGQVLNLQPASASFGGVVTTGTQTFAGNKKLTGQLTVENLSAIGYYDGVPVTPGQFGIYALTLGDGGAGFSLYATHAALFQSTAEASAFIPNGSTVPLQGMYSSAANTLNFATNTTNRLAITSAGHVGIGTTTPSSAFTTTVSINSATGSQGLLFRLNNVDKGYIYNSSDNLAIGSNSGAIIFNPADTERMRITSAGRLGIGTTSPVATLHANNTSSADPTALTLAPTTNIFGMSTSPGGMLAGGIGSTGGTYVWLQGRNTGAAGVSYPISLQPLGGNVGIGTASPSYLIELGSDSAAKPTSALWTIASDERIKENITPYTKGLADLLQINPINYDYNGLGGFKKGKGGVGIIAQQIMDILPDSVSSVKGKLNETDEEEIDILNFNGHELTYVLINAIKELKAEIDLLKT